MRDTRWHGRGRGVVVARAVALVGMLTMMIQPSVAAPSAGGFASENVEWLGHHPYVINGEGGRLVGNRFYASDQNKIMVFDVSTPELPVLSGVFPMPQEWLFGREDIDTNGSILIYPNNFTRSMHVLDVRDEHVITPISNVPGANDHTMSCVLGCTWAYGSDGTVVDLRDPARPVRKTRDWNVGLPGTDGHDVEEVSPGRVITATQPIMLLDANADPARPALLATGSNADGRFIHTARWPRAGADRFLLASGETNFRPSCGPNTGAFMTWDTTGWQTTGRFTMVDQFRVSNGPLTSGNAPINVVGCSSHWFEAHPDFNDGGTVAAAFFEHGVRFLNVDAAGRITEKGWFLGHGNSAGAAYWITDEIVYVIDYNRGLDVIRFTGA